MKEKIERTAEEQLCDDIIEFDPDVALLIIGCTDRSNATDDDIDFIKKVREKYYKKNNAELPVVVALNRVDGVMPARETDPNSYSEKKLNRIETMQRSFLKRSLIRNSLMQVL